MDKEELEAIAELKAMKKEDLEGVHHDVKKLACMAKRCHRYTQVWDFGILPEYYSPRKKVWLNSTVTFWLCGAHHKFYQRMIKKYDKDLVQEKLLDLTKPTLP